jgi:hypothetical protein
MLPSSYCYQKYKLVKPGNFQNKAVSDIGEHHPEKVLSLRFLVQPSRCESWKVAITAENVNINNP